MWLSLGKSPVAETCKIDFGTHQAACKNYGNQIVANFSNDIFIEQRLFTYYLSFWITYEYESEVYVGILQ